MQVSPERAEVITNGGVTTAVGTLSSAMIEMLVRSYAYPNEIAYGDRRTLTALHGRGIVTRNGFNGKLTTFGTLVRQQLVQKKYKVENIHAISGDECVNALREVVRIHEDEVNRTGARKPQQRGDILRRSVYLKLIQEYVTQQEAKHGH